MLKEDVAKVMARTALLQKFKKNEIAGNPIVEEAVYNDVLTWKVSFPGVAVDFMPGEKLLTMFISIARMAK